MKKRSKDSIKFINVTLNEIKRLNKVWMKIKILYWLILLIPFIGMITINEFVRLNSNNEGYNIQGVNTINTNEKLKEKCSWICHNNTNYCKKNHVKLTKIYLNKIDPIYFGIINSLKSTGDYGLANIIFLVILLPLTIYVLLVKSISIQFKISKLKKKNI